MITLDQLKHRKQGSYRAQTQHMYNNKRWRKMRARQLALFPLCKMCQQKNKTTPATVADHVIPHGGNVILFWSHANLQSLCHACHNVKTNTE